MRLLRHVLALLFFFSLTAIGRSQEVPKDDAPQEDSARKVKPLEFGKIRVGFDSYEKNGSPYYKPGFWTPVRVQLHTGNKAITDGRLILGTTDNEDVNTTTSTRIDLGAKSTRTFVSYVMPGNWSALVDVSVNAFDRTFTVDNPQTELGKVDLTAQIFLTLPTKIPSLRDALVSLNRMEVQPEPGKNQPALPNAKLLKPGNADVPPDDAEETSTWPRFAAFESDSKTLPGLWKGYHGVDTIILTTDNKEFLESLMRGNLNRLEAIAQWVRNGGHLIISVSPDNQKEVSQLLQSPAWKPALPVKLPIVTGNVQANSPERLQDVERWAGESNIPFRVEKGKFPIAQLSERQGPASDWEVLAVVHPRDDDRPVITRAAYGRGQIVFIAFALEKEPFSTWKGRNKFWTKLIYQVAPRLAPAEAVNAPGIPIRRGFRKQSNARGGDDAFGPEADLVSSLHRTLDNFNVKSVPFGLVALFIFLYILVVGPLDYLLLKYVFKRLDLTWITFPAVVFAVSLAAYFTAYAIKGKDLRINQIDLLDFDLRTQKAKAYVYGQSFFTVFSPRIHNYSIRLEPNPRFWGQSVNEPMSADMITWLPRGGWRDPSGINRRGRQSLIRSPYSYAGDAESRDEVGLERVLIPIWATKAFTATWNAELPQMPFKADLVYHQDADKEVLVTGQLSSNLDVDLEDVWMMYRNWAYPLGERLKGKEAAELKVSLESGNLAKKDFSNWAKMPDSSDVEGRSSSDKGIYNPTLTMKKILFYENADPSTDLHNQWLRLLDYSWRLREEDRKFGGMREAVLYARVHFRSGPIGDLLLDSNRPLPTFLRLGNFSGGTMNQDTYIRILLPVHPAEGL